DQLDSRIADTYAKYSSATLKNSLYDSYIRGFRWGSDRIKDKGIVCFVSNGSFIDNNAMDGFRKCLVDEFTSIYCFNLRGNARTSGEQRRQEKGNVFGEGTRTTIAIILLIKNPEQKQECKLFYHDIGDYLSQKEKLDIIKGFGDVSTIQWSEITPNENYDWINQRNDDFESFISLGDKKDATTRTIFDISSNGLQTNRDSWAYNFSNSLIFYNMKRMIEFYNSQLNENEINHDPKYISWTRGLKTRLIKKEKLDLDLQCMRIAIYRPYCKEWLYFSKYFNEYVYQMPKIFPNQNLENLVICISGLGGSKEQSTFISNIIVDQNMQHSGTKCFPLYTYEKQSELGELFATATTAEYTKKENIPDSILKDFQKKYQDK
ncbi:MAG: type ISP restriction/modification enzyme, partial [Dolichospermum sp.]